MNRYRAYWPRDEAPIRDGDRGWVGVNSRLKASLLPPGYAAEARNARFRDGVAETRRGAYVPPWAVSAGEGKLYPYGQFYGAPGVFKDPNNEEVAVWAADGYVYRAYAHNDIQTVPLPEGVQILTECSFVQAYDKLWLFRGRYCKPLVCSSLTTGFEDLVEWWAPGESYEADDEVAWGPVTVVSGIAIVNGEAEVTTATPHGYVSGLDVQIGGSPEAAFVGRFTITVTGESTFTFRPRITWAADDTTSNARVWPASTYYKAIGTPPRPTTTHRSRSTDVATIKSTAHGLVNGDRVSITGMGDVSYNVVDAVVTRTDADTFTVPNDGPDEVSTPDTGGKIQRTPANDTGRWEVTGLIMPNGQNPVYLQNRLMVPSWWDPTEGTWTGDAYRSKRDYVASSYILDERHLDVLNLFRINQGSSDELLGLAKLTDTEVVALKTRSVYLLSGLYGDSETLSTTLRLDALITEYGVCAERAWATVGRDVYFMSPQRGVVSLRMTEQGKVSGAEQPLSAPIDALIRRINWAYGHKIRMAYWDNRLYVAVPLDDAKWESGNMIEAMTFPPGHYVQANGIVPEETYRFEPASNGYGIEVGGVVYEDPCEFTARSSIVQMEGKVGDVWDPQVRRVIRGVNNAVLVYDFLNQAWCGMDDGAACCVREWLVYAVGGREVLLALCEDGLVRQWETTDYGDEHRVINATRMVRAAEIEFELLTRGYTQAESGMGLASQARMWLATINPRFTVTQEMDGAAEVFAVTTQQTRDRTRYARPFDAAPYAVSNAGANFATPYREDYSQPVSDGTPVQNLESLMPELWQEMEWPLRLRPRRGRGPQLRIANDQGRLRLLGLELSAQRPARNLEAKV